MNNEKIFIIGFGAIGKALAVFLIQKGKEVIAVRSSINGNSSVDHRISVETENGKTIIKKVQVATLDSLNEIDGLIILTTKSLANDSIAKSLKHKSGNSPIVILQNGMNVEVSFLEERFSHLYRCVLFATSQVIDSGIVRFRPVAESPVGMIMGDSAMLNHVVNQINSPYFSFRAENDILPFVWKKTIINAIFNSICPLLGTDNGIFYREPLSLQIAKRILQSGITIARANGIELAQDDMEKNLINISKSSDGQLISTLQDINHRRNTEIDSLNFEIIRMAEKKGIGDIANEIRLLGELIKIKEKINL